MKKEQTDLKMYCVLCKKSVLGFDHHCAWLNTCIGSRQYPFFLMLTFLGLLTNGLHLAVVGILLFRDSDFVEAKAEDVLGDVIVLYVYLGIQAFMAFGATFSFGTLASFHVRLQFLGYGTYQFLINKRKQQREKEYERASRADYDEITFKERVNGVCGCCFKEKEDAASRMTLEVSRVDSVVMKSNMVSGDNDKFDVDLNEENYNQKAPAELIEDLKTKDEENEETKQEEEKEEVKINEETFKTSGAVAEEKKKEESVAKEEV